MESTNSLLESWDRQCRITKAVADLIDDSSSNLKPSPDGWPLYVHLAHMHKVRKFHLHELDPEGAAALAELFRDGWDNPIDDLDAIKQALDDSAAAVRHALKQTLDAGEVKVGGYDHPVFFLQHLVFHEGWHIGLIFLAFRLAGKEIPEEWEETRVWAEWRSD